MLTAIAIVVLLIVIPGIIASAAKDDAKAVMLLFLVVIVFIVGLVAGFKLALSPNVHITNKPLDTASYERLIDDIQGRIVVAEFIDQPRGDLR